MLDKFARNQGIPFPGGPKIEILASEWHSKNSDADVDDIPLPYSVQGMDLNFSGILNAAQQRINEGHELGAVCWSLQEHSFAACIEVAERALAHTGKNELLLGGGVACNERIREMTNLMCNQRGSVGTWPEKRFSCIKSLINRGANRILIPMRDHLTLRIVIGHVLVQESFHLLLKI